MPETAAQERYVDLHLHTNHSDGSDSPTRVVERAAEAGLTAMAITDHDTVSAIAEASDAAVQFGIEFLAGVEISSKLDRNEVHILGLGVDSGPGPLVDALQKQAAARRERADRIVAKLNKLGVPVEREAIARQTSEGVVGRMHIAKEIVALGHARSVQHAFDKYIKSGRPAHVPKEVLAVGDAVDLIHAAGGLAIVAHPGLGGLHHRLDELLSYPFDGIEAQHSRHSPGQILRFTEIAQSRGLLISGGSDCHGTIKGEEPLMGSVQVPYAIYENLKRALAA